MRQHLQQLSRKLFILLLEALAVGALIVLAFVLSPSSDAPHVVATATPTPAPAPKPPSISPDSATHVLELFSPSDTSLTHQLNDTTVRQHIEQIVATSYVLGNCKHITPANYRDSFRALIVYAQRTKFADSYTSAETKVREIAQAASASYSLLYYRTPCDAPKLIRVREQLLAWQKAYLDQ